MKTAYLFQAFIVLLWWIGIDQSETFYDMFRFDQFSRDAFQCFLLPDVIVIAGLSLVYSYKNIDHLNFVILGGFLYSTLFCYSAAWFTGGGEISVILMTAGLGFNLFLCYHQLTFRSSRSKSFSMNLFKTLIQIFCMWGIFLFIIPYFIVQAERAILEQPFQFELKWLAVPMFLLFSSGGLWSSYVLSKQGEGTPIPFDATNQLVVSGPYRYIRNPMSLCGLGQGFAVALYTSSVSMIVFCLLGFFCWNYVIRTFEERDLEEKFGQAYLDYKSQVRCWIPTFPGYRN